MRITEKTLYQGLVQSIENNLNVMNRLQKQISSGIRFSTLSEDPVRASKSVNLNLALDKSEQYQRNVDDALGWMQATQNALTDVEGIMNETRTLALSMSSEVSSEARQAAALTVQTLRGSLVELGNRQYFGKSLFGGGAVTTDAFTSAGVYQGDTTRISRLTGPGELSAVNIQGEELFITGTDLFQVLDDLDTALQNDDPVAVNAEITNIDAALSKIYTFVASYGADQQQMESTKFQLQDAHVILEEQRHNNDDTDIATAFVSLTAAENQYQAALTVSARLLSQNNLVNFLG